MNEGGNFKIGGKVREKKFSLNPTSTHPDLGTLRGNVFTT